VEELGLSGRGIQLGVIDSSVSRAGPHGQLDFKLLPFVAFQRGDFDYGVSVEGGDVVWNRKLCLKNA
jgi:hypothetical protein